MKALVFGKTGQVATELRRCAPAGVALIPFGRDQADLADPAACAAAIATQAADVVINAAAYTAVDKAEEEEIVATTINGAAPAAMARAAATKGVPFLHISTDYVFDGWGGRPWRPDDPVAPLGAYGRSKLVGEEGVREAGGVYAILRTSWVFSAHGSNFVRTMLRLGQTRDRLSVVADQMGGPTAAGDIAQALWIMAAAFHRGEGATGIYHFAGSPDVSWAGFAREIFARADMTVGVAGIPSNEFPTPARRPANSRLDCTGLKAAFGIARPDWRDSLAAVLQELGGQ